MGTTGARGWTGADGASGAAVGDAAGAAAGTTFAGVLTPGEISSCEASLDDGCGSKFQALMDCAASVEQCNADGTEDGQATLAASATACSGTRKVWVACERALLDSAGGE
jgi:hypothetical protein